MQTPHLGISLASMVAAQREFVPAQHTSPFHSSQPTLLVINFQLPRIALKGSEIQYLTVPAFVLYVRLRKL